MQKMAVLLLIRRALVQYNCSNMIKAVSIFSFFWLCTLSFAQQVQKNEFDKELKSLLSFTVPTVDVSWTAAHFEDVLILDAREYEEYAVSHLPNARYIGYNDVQMSSLKHVSKSTPLVVYCSVGYRSEKIAEKLQKMGYTKVYNLYGSIFEWANCQLPLYNEKGVLTDTVHTYNKSWSKWVDSPKIVKVW